MTPDAEICAQLKSVMLDGLTRRAPYKGSAGSGRLFTGSYDWHSSVHAHWALLSMSRVLDDEPLQQMLLRRLSGRRLEAERKYLLDEANAHFEMPYGRAWLCLLLSELSRHPAGIPAGSPASTCDVARFGQQVGSQVALWLEQNAASHELMRCGSHQSWLFAFLLLQMSRPAAPIQARLDALRERIERARPVIKALESAPPLGYDFLHLPAILALIDGERPHAEDAPCLSFAEPDEFNCHQSGANATRLWPHARAQSSRFREGLEPMLSRREQWAGDFRLVAHWVPQFLWLGLMMERGELIELPQVLEQVRKGQEPDER